MLALQALPKIASAPKATITLERMENGKAVYLPLAPEFEGAKAQIKLVLACLIKNNESTDLALSNVTFSFPGTSIPAKNMQGENLVTGPIAPGESAWWSNGVVELSEDNKVNNAIFMDAPAPAKVEVSLTFTGYNAAHQNYGGLGPSQGPGSQWRLVVPVLCL